MRWISAIGGIVATGAALAVLVSLPTGTPLSDAADSSIEPTTQVESPSQEIVLEQPVLPDLSVPELGDEVAGVLAESGYTQFVGSTELSEMLPDDVVQVLIDEGATLVIPSEDGG